jgi:hypothetical protein
MIIVINNIIIGLRAERQRAGGYLANAANRARAQVTFPPSCQPSPSSQTKPPDSEKTADDI